MVGLVGLVGVGLKKVICGSGHTGMGPWWDVLFLYGHGQFSSKLFDEITEVCTTAGLKTGGYPDPSACQPLLDQIDVEVWSALYPSTALYRAIV